MSTEKGPLYRLLTMPLRFAGLLLGGALTAAAVLLPHRAASDRARKNADALIAACRAFQAKQGRLPARLEELVPDFLPELPRAKFDGPHFGFTYDVNEAATRHVLGWTEVIPFGRPFYVFEEDRWGYLD
jgi:hypothetical protein